MMYQKAIDKLRHIQKDNMEMVASVESGEFKINASPERIKSLLDTYKWWGHCSGMAAWLLENATNKDSEQ